LRKNEQQQQSAANGLQQQQQQQRPWFHYLVLDCDGVLVDTEAASCESLRRAILQVTGGRQQQQQQHMSVCGACVPISMRFTAACDTASHRWDAAAAAVVVRVPVCDYPLILTSCRRAPVQTGGGCLLRVSSAALTVCGNTTRTPCCCLLSAAAAGVDIPHAFPGDFTAVFGMDVRSCIEYYKQALGRCAEAGSGVFTTDLLSCLWLQYEVDAECSEANAAATAAAVVHSTAGATGLMCRP
jgi:hypothetical protein